MAGWRAFEANAARPLMPGHALRAGARLEVQRAARLHAFVATAARLLVPGRARWAGARREVTRKPPSHAM
eukprot:7886197-Lingulodinium_polyedra.AAC.1